MELATFWVVTFFDMHGPIAEKALGAWGTCSQALTAAERHAKNSGREPVEKQDLKEFGFPMITQIFVEKDYTAWYTIQPVSLHNNLDGEFSL